MKFLLRKNEFESFLKTIIALNENPDAVKCNIVNVQLGEDEYWVTLCFNENKSQVEICRVQDLSQEIEIEDDEIKKKCFEELINTTITNEELYDFYKKEIEPVTEGCELNQ
jgi:hypothetical protein